MDAHEHPSVAAGQSFMVLETKPKQNIGTVLRCAVAFGVNTIVIIGSPKFGTHGAHGAQKFIPVLHFYYWENFFHFAEVHDIKIIGLCNEIAIAENNLFSTPVQDYEFLSTEKYAFGIFPRGVQEHIITRCHKLLHVNYPAGQEIGALVNFDATVSICLQCYRMTTIQIKMVTLISKEKFVLGEMKKPSGVVHMDSGAYLSLEQSCAEEEEFGLFCFGDIGDIDS